MKSLLPENDTNNFNLCTIRKLLHVSVTVMIVKVSTLPVIVIKVYNVTRRYSFACKQKFITNLI